MKRTNLSLHVNRDVETSPAPLSNDRQFPVVRAIDSPEGLVEYKVRNANGVRIGFFQISASAMDDTLLEAMHDWQARHAGHDRPDLVVES